MVNPDVLKNKNRYNAQIVAGSLLLPESRHVAQLLLKNVNSEEWNKAIIRDNILQKRSPATARRQANLIRNRLKLMGPVLWKLVAEGNKEVATQALLAAALKHSCLLGDFMYQTVRERWQTFERRITATDWNRFMEMCTQAEPHIFEWSESTMAKLRQVIFRILAEARYLESTRSLKLLPVSIVPEVRSYLINNSEDYVLRCMDVTG